MIINFNRVVSKLTWVLSFRSLSAASISGTTSNSLDRCVKNGRNAELEAVLHKTAKDMKDAQTQSIVEILDLCTEKESRIKDQTLTLFLSSCQTNEIFKTVGPRIWSPDQIISVVMALAILYKQRRDRGTPNLKILAMMLTKSMSSQLHQMLQEKRFRTKQIPKLVYALGVLEYHEASVLKALSSQIENESLLASFSPMSLSNLIYGLSQLGITDFYYREKLSKFVLDNVGLKAFGDRELAALLYSAIKMGWENLDIDKKLAEEACHWMRVLNYNSWCLSSVCFSLGHLRSACQPDLTFLVRHLKKKDVISGLDSQGLIHVAHGMHRMKIGDREFWTMLAKEIARPRRLNKFTEQGLATLVYCFGSVMSTPMHWNHLLDEVVKPERLSSFTDTSLMTLFMGLKSCSYYRASVFEKLIQEINKPERLVTLSLRNLTAIALCIGHHQFSNIKSVRPIFHEIFHCSNRLEVDPQMISLTIYSLGKLKRRIMSTNEINFYLEKVMDPGIITKFTPQGYSCLIFGLGELKFPSKSKILKYLVRNILLMKLRNFGTFELCNIVFGLGRCGFSVSQSTGVMLNELLKEERLNQMTTTHLTTLMMSIGMHQLEDQQAIDSVMARILKPPMFRSLSSNEISKILFALSQLPYSDQSHIKTLFNRLLENRFLEDHVLTRVLSSLGTLEYQNESDWMSLVQRLSKVDLKKLNPEALSNVLFAMSKVDSGQTILRDQILQELMKDNILKPMKEIGLIKVLEALVVFDVKNEFDAQIEKVLIELLVKHERRKRLKRSDMLRIIDCLCKAKMLTKSNMGQRFMSAIMDCRDAFRFPDISHQQLLYLIASLKHFMNSSESVLNLPRLTSILEKELYKLERHNGIGMVDMMNAISVLKNVKETTMKSISPFLSLA